MKSFRSWSCLLGCILLTLISSSHLSAQTKAADEEVEKYLQKVKQSFGQPDSMLRYAKTAYAKAKSTKQINLKANAAKLLGVALHVNSKSMEAIPYYEESLRNFETLKDTLEIGKAHLNLAISYSAKEDFKQTIHHALLALDQFKLSMNESGEGRVYNLLGMIYSSQKEMAKALNYFHQYVALSKRAGDSVEVASAYNNLGNTYMQMNKIDSSLYFLHLGEQLNSSIGMERNNGAVYHNLGDIYLSRNDQTKALHYFNKSYNINKASNHKRLQATSLVNLATIESRKKLFQKAANYLNEALVLGKELNDFDVLNSAYKGLAMAENELGRPAEAYRLLKEAFVYQDSVNVNRNNSALMELQTRYETEKSTQKIKDLHQQTTIQELKLKQQRTLLIASLSLLLAVSFLAYFIYNQRRQKELQLKLKAELDLQKMALLSKEKLFAERKRISNDLHDNIGSYLTFINTAMDDIEKDQEGKVKQLKGLTSETIKELRKTVWLINKDAVSLEEFEIKLKDFFKHLSILQIKVSGQKTRVLNASQVTEVFRLIQEAVNNALKHSDASQIIVQLAASEEKLQVEVSDNGKGFDQRSNSDGFGLNTMRQRVEHIGGTFELKSESPGGTCITAVFHLS